MELSGSDTPSYSALYLVFLLLEMGYVIELVACTSHPPPPATPFKYGNSFLLRLSPVLESQESKA